MPKSPTELDPGRLIALIVARPETDRTDDRILASAARAVLGSGLASFEVDEVAGAAGVGRSTVYRRFGDRNGLIAAALAHEARGMLTTLAEAVAPPDDDDDRDLASEIAAAFCAGLAMARATGLSDVVARDALLLRLLTVEGAPLVAAARDHLVAMALDRDPTVDSEDAARRAELLVRLAVSFLVTSESALDLGGAACVTEVRRHIVPLVVRG